MLFFPLLFFRQQKRNHGLGSQGSPDAKVLLSEQLFYVMIAPSLHLIKSQEGTCDEQRHQLQRKEA